MSSECANIGDTSHAQPYSTVFEPHLWIFPVVETVEEDPDAELHAANLAKYAERRMADTMAVEAGLPGFKPVHVMPTQLSATDLDLARSQASSVAPAIKPAAKRKPKATTQIAVTA